MKYRHFSESSDESANTKSTQTTSLGSNNGQENKDKQPLTTLPEMDFEYADAETDSDTELDINHNLALEKRPLTKDSDNDMEETLIDISNEINHGTAPCDREKNGKQPRNKLQKTECSCSCSEGVENVDNERKYSDKIQAKTRPSRTECEDAPCGSKIADQGNNNKEPVPDIRETYNISDRKTPYDLCSSWNNASPNTYVDFRDDVLSTSSRTRDHEVERLLKRDHYIHELQCTTNLMNLFEERYKSMLEDMNRKQDLLKASLMWLTIMFIVIILCVAVSMIYSVTRNPGHVGEIDVEKSIERYMGSQEAQDDIRRHVLCADCSDVRADVMPFFTRDENNECCIRDVATLSAKMEESFSLDAHSQNARITQLENSLNELQQTANFKMIITRNSDKNATENVVELDTVLENSLTKIKRNEQLINSLMERRRWTGHWIGRKNEIDRRMMWIPTGNIDQREKTKSPVISIEGGIYFVYGSIRFSCRQTNKGINVGYSIDEIGSRGGPQSLASVKHECSNGTSTDQDLILQRIIYIPVNQAKKIKLSLVGPNTSISSAYEHSFGIFEI